jgi:hypothetical protein
LKVIGIGLKTHFEFGFRDRPLARDSLSAFKLSAIWHPPVPHIAPLVAGLDVWKPYGRSFGDKRSRAVFRCRIRRPESAPADTKQLLFFSAKNYPKID